MFLGRDHYKNMDFSKAKRKSRKFLEVGGLQRTPWNRNSRGVGGPKEFTHSMSQVQARVKFKSRAKFESESNLYFSLFFSSLYVWLLFSLIYINFNDVLVINGKIYFLVWHIFFIIDHWNHYHCDSLPHLVSPVPRPQTCDLASPSPSHLSTQSHVASTGHTRWYRIEPRGQNVVAMFFSQLHVGFTRYSEKL